MTTLVDIRDAVYESILVSKDKLVITDFDLFKTYYPQTKIQEIAKPRVFVVGLQWSEEKLSRGNSRQLDLPVQVAIQDKVLPSNTEEIDFLVCFTEQLRRLVSKVECSGIVWTNTDPMLDPNGTALSFMELHEEHLFQATFTAHFIAAVC